MNSSPNTNIAYLLCVLGPMAAALLDPSWPRSLASIFIISHLTKGEGNLRKRESLLSLVCLFIVLGGLPPYKRTPDLELTGSPEVRESHHALEFPKQQDALEPHSLGPCFGLEGPGPREPGPERKLKPLASQLQEPRRRQRPGKERGVSREAPPRSVTWGAGSEA